MPFSHVCDAKQAQAVCESRVRIESRRVRVCPACIFRERTSTRPCLVFVLSTGMESLSNRTASWCSTDLDAAFRRKLPLAFLVHAVLICLTRGKRIVLIKP